MVMTEIADWNDDTQIRPDAHTGSASLYRAVRVGMFEARAGAVDSGS